MLTRMLQKAVEADPKKVAVVQETRRITYEELSALVGRFAGGLRRLGVGMGDCVAVALPNCPEFVAGLFACAQLRTVMLPLDPQGTAAEWLDFLADARAKVVITDSTRTGRFRDASALVTEFDAILSHSAAPVPSGQFDGPALYLYTSGSTDSRKRLCCTQENLFYEALNFVETVGLTAADNILCTIPLHHSYGIGNCILDAVYTGSTLVLLDLDEAPFAARCRRLAELVRVEGIRFFPGVPYQFQILAALPNHAAFDLTGLSLCVSSGDVLPRQTYDRFFKRFGLPIRSLYGSTEAGSISINMDRPETLQFGSLGPPLQNATIRIRDDAGIDLPQNENGQIWVKSPVIPRTCYENLPELSAQVFRDGYYNTGDLGRLDERGYLVMTGRKQTFVDVGGHKVDVTEVEEVLLNHPRVREAAVLGVEVPRVGTVLKAAVVTEGPCRPADIQGFCRQRLAFYKVPRLIEAYPSLPRSTMGKVQKSELRGVESYLDDIRNPDATRILGRLSTVSAEKRRSLVSSLIQAQVAAVLGQPVATVSRDAGFVELGMDSFGAIELLARLEYLFDQELPQTFTFDYPTVDAVTESLLGIRH